MNSNYYTEWFNENEGRAYPLAERATRIDNQGVRMSDGLLADLHVVVPAGYTGIMITSLSVSRFTASIGVSASGTGLLIGTYVRDLVKPYLAYPLVGVVDNVSGWVVFGNGLTNDTTYMHKFSTSAQSGLEDRTIHRVDPPAVRRFFKYGGRTDLWLDGDVRLACNANMRIFEDQAALTPTVEIGLDPAVASQMAGPCLKSASKDNCSTPPIRTINGVQADNTGKVTLEFV
jgi:hypothetical protein